MPVAVRNPHSVLAALETRPKDVLSVSASTKADGDAWEKVVRLAREAKVSIQSPSSLPKGKQTDGGRQGTAEASIKERSPIAPEELFTGAKTRKGGKGLWLALDSLQDPHNVGAIFRAAAFFGVEGILITSERSAPLTSAVYDVACGGVEYVPFSMQINLVRGFEIAKEAGLWILGASEHAGDSLKSIERDRPWLLVLGNEEKGMRRLTEESCDLLCKIPALGPVTSLNVSVAAGVLISHLTST